MKPIRLDPTLKALSVLLSYPSDALKEALPEIRGILAAEKRLSERTRKAILALLDHLETGDIWDLQAEYVELFDRSRSLSLNLFEHVHGESRERGGAMVELLEIYRRGGFDLKGVELPDHLPVLLEYLATRPPGEMREMLGDAAHILEALRQRLERRSSRYAAVFAALTELADARPSAKALEPLLAVPDEDPNDLEAIDAAWEETEVVFGPDPGAGCPEVRKMLARIDTASPAPAKPH